MIKILPLFFFTISKVFMLNTHHTKFQVLMSMKSAIILATISCFNCPPLQSLNIPNRPFYCLLQAFHQGLFCQVLSHRRSMKCLVQGAILSVWKKNLNTISSTRDHRMVSFCCMYTFLSLLCFNMSYYINLCINS